jgi:phosphotransferase system HPr (HPr) family protein
MLELRVKVRNPLGLHARAAGQLVKLADKFCSSITIARVDNSAVADAKSILSVLTIAASQGTELFVRTDGADEKEAVNAICELFSSGFGEL